MTVSIHSKFPFETERNGRALIAQLSDLIGARPSGPALVTAPTGTVTLPPNTYAVPIVNGNERRRELVKVAFNPATTRAHRQGGEWTIAGTTAVTFIGNVGGVWSVPAGAKLRFEPPVAGLNELATVADAGITGGNEAGGLARTIVLYDEFDEAPNWEMFRAEADAGPLIVLYWLRSMPVEGRSGYDAGKSRQGRARRMLFKEWQALCITTSMVSHHDRWSAGMALHEAASALWDFRKRNNDGEQLTFGGKGVEVMEQARVSPDSVPYQAFRISLRTIGGRGRIDQRVFPPWLWTRISSFVAPDADHDAELSLADTTVPMVQDDAILAALRVTDGQTEPELHLALGWETDQAITPHLEDMALRGLVVEDDDDRWWVAPGPG